MNITIRNFLWWCFFLIILVFILIVFFIFFFFFVFIVFVFFIWITYIIIASPIVFIVFSWISIFPTTIRITALLVSFYGIRAFVLLSRFRRFIRIVIHLFYNDSLFILISKFD